MKVAICTHTNWTVASSLTIIFSAPKPAPTMAQAQPTRIPSTTPSHKQAKTSSISTNYATQMDTTTTQKAIPALLAINPAWRVNIRTRHVWAVSTKATTMRKIIALVRVVALPLTIVGRVGINLCASCVLSNMCWLRMPVNYAKI